MKLRSTFLTALLVLASACEDGALVTDAVDAGPEPTADGVDTDQVAEDGALDGSAPGEISAPDAPLPDAGRHGPCETDTGCFQDPCDEPEDCNSGICVPHMGEKVCSKT